MKSLCVVLCALISLVYAQTPTPPQFPDVFYATVRAELTEGSDGWVGGGLYAYDVPSGKARIDVQLDGNGGRLSFHELDRYDLNTTYVIGVDEVCTKQAATGKLESPWIWVASSTFNGTSSVGGQTLNIWTYTDSKMVTYKVYVAQSNPDIPVFMLETTSNGTYVTEWNMTFLEFNASAPGDWAFYIPQNCNGNMPGGDIGNVVYFANKNWNCGDPLCSFLVPEGTGQPSYGCAEFAARSIAHGNYFPGLDAYDPVAAFQNWTGYALTFTVTLADALIYIGFKDAGTDPSGVHAATVAFGDGGEGYWSHACIGVGDDVVDAHNNARYHRDVEFVLPRGIDAMYSP